VKLILIIGVIRYGIGRPSPLVIVHDLSLISISFIRVGCSGIGPMVKRA
jgi:uridine phosphorylase